MSQQESQNIQGHIFKACKSGKGTSYDVATVLYIMYRDKYMCISKVDKTSYYLNDKNIWIKDNELMFLRSKISTELYRQFSKLCVTEQQWSLESDDNHAKNAAKIQKVMLRLKDNIKFKNDIMDQSMELFYDFYQKFVQKSDIIVFNNGIYDLEKEIFREIRPEDYITKTIGLDYVDFSSTDPTVKKFIRVLLNKLSN